MAKDIMIGITSAAGELAAQQGLQSILQLLGDDRLTRSQAVAKVGEVIGIVADIDVNAIDHDVLVTIASHINPLLRTARYEIVDAAELQAAWEAWDRSGRTPSPEGARIRAVARAIESNVAILPGAMQEFQAARKALAETGLPVFVSKAPLGDEQFAEQTADLERAVVLYSYHSEPFETVKLAVSAVGPDSMAPDMVHEINKGEITSDEDMEYWHGLFSQALSLPISDAQFSAIYRVAHAAAQLNHLVDSLNLRKEFTYAADGESMVAVVGGKRVAQEGPQDLEVALAEARAADAAPAFRPS